MIDPHVHCRDWNQKHKETIEHALSVAERVGLSGIFDMPNTDPTITSRGLVEKRLNEADSISGSVFYGLYVGLTAAPVQIKEAVATYREFFPKVVGLKMFAGHSVGDLGIIEEARQELVYRTLAEEGYNGVLAVHCEKESWLRNELWNPKHPESHSYARPPWAETKSIEDQIMFATAANFKGVLHIPHISLPESVRLVSNTRKDDKIKITCGVTPHHCTLSYFDIIKLGSRALIYKVNPPLRSKSTPIMMLEYLKEGLIDWIETDHAPHTLIEKLQPPFMSGFPGLPFYPHFLNVLRNYGFTGNELRNLTHDNICRTFGIDIPLLEREPVMDLHKEYEVDVYLGVRK